MKDLRVALISEEFPPFTFGGVGSHCFDLAHSLSKKGVYTTVLSGRSKEKKEEIVNDYLRIVRLPFFDAPPRFLWFQLQNYKLFSETLINHDILHGVNPQASSLVALLKKRLSKPFVTTVHEFYLRNMKLLVTAPFAELTLGDIGLSIVEYPLNELLLRYCLKNADHVVACGDNTYHELKRSYRFLENAKMSVIPNGINFKMLGISREEEVDCGDTRFDSCIIFYGRFVWAKGILHLIKAIDILKRKHKNVRLKLFGKGPLEQAIRKLVSGLVLEENVSVEGFLTRTDLIKQIRNASVVVLPSMSEVGPFIAALEAMACKKPVVAFDFPFAREFIEDMENGLLAQAGNVEDLSDKIDILLSDEGLRKKLGCNAYEYVKKNHDWDKLVDRYIQLYENLL